MNFLVTVAENVCKFQRKVLGVGYPVSWAPCCGTWLSFKIKVRLLEKIKVRDFYLLGSYPLVGRHVVDEPKVT